MYLRLVKFNYNYNIKIFLNCQLWQLIYQLFFLTSNDYFSIILILKIMIKLHKLNNNEFVINAEFIQVVESIPDTRITLTDGNNFIVRESVDEVINKTVEYKQKIHSVKSE